MTGIRFPSIIAQVFELPAMKHTTLILSLVLAAGTTIAQDEAKPAPAASSPAAFGIPRATPEALAAEADFLKLPAEERQKFGTLLGESQRLLAEKRVPEALRKLGDAETMVPLHPDVLNLKASCLIRIRDFERALPAKLQGDAHA